MPTNIKSSQGSIALKNAAMKRTTCNFIPCSACKYCGIRHTHTLRHAHTRGGGVGCRTDRKQRTEVSNKQGKATPLSILGPEENNGRRQRAGLNAVRQSSAPRKSPPTSAANTTLTQVTRKYDTCLCLWMHPLRKKTATLTLWRPVHSCLLGDVCAAHDSSPGSAPFSGM